MAILAKERPHLGIKKDERGNWTRHFRESDYTYEMKTLCPATMFLSR